MKKFSILLSLFFVFSMCGMASSAAAPFSFEDFKFQCMDKSLFEVHNPSLWRMSFCLPFFQDFRIELTDKTNPQVIIKVPLNRDSLYNIDSLLNASDEDRQSLLGAANSSTIINLLQTLCVLGIKRGHPLFKLVLQAHSQEDVHASAVRGLHRYLDFYGSDRVLHLYPFMERRLVRYVSIMQGEHGNYDEWIHAE